VQPGDREAGQAGQPALAVDQDASSTTAVSSSIVTTPVARLSYQSAVVWVIPVMAGGPVRASSCPQHHRPGAAPPLGRL